jgi:hypothetical protein
MSLKKIVGGAAVLAAAVTISLTASAQQLGFSQRGAWTNLAAGASSASVIAPNNLGLVSVQNMGSNPACVAVGNSTVPATSTGALCTHGDFIQAGQSIGYVVGQGAYFATIDTNAGTTTLQLSGGGGVWLGSWGSIFGTVANPSYLANNPVGASTLTTGQSSSIGSSSVTTLVSAQPGNPGIGRICLNVTQASTVPVYLGNASGTNTVTATNGDLLTGVIGLEKEICTTAGVGAITAAGTGAVTFRYTD